eukprot:TRINITY_DN13945_c2_g1_i1.p1 TRINITY_DN13945_c2_g1~~TRINITY_DN13945_c2_g1_i1.p1  ORF type:complete len:227 (+),score=79.43 TRINITY_DN13945_c2_g1_i1:90-683(+)
MELCGAAVKTLRALRDASGSALDNGQLSALAQWSLDGLRRPVSDAPGAAHPQLAQVDGLALRSVHSALTLLYTEAAKHAASQEEVADFLEHACGWSDRERSAAVAGAGYAAALPELRAQLRAMAPARPRVVSGAWRIDHVLGDREVDPPTKSDTRFSLSFELSDAERGPLRLSCTAEQMQVFIEKLRDMLREPHRHG